ncbi:Heme-degrading monooxygenase HmoB [Jeotgalicoccus saudimassiliensis]|uniref:Signal transduction protein TRAP n=1 Tax=Jeotgalicoccus saudimassiliensis TaxID=1461582 RepID=A0A078M7T3_9STAP|nr:antibiotic biosynthesis monooxygenase [Jeotgalicoccus saudimassiliensis]CEA00696.1 Heme-degrading monooxygenase HmoB [Jeotgalicoccus saudimassiliensis]
MKLVNKEGQNTELIIEGNTAAYKGENWDILIHDGDVSAAGHVATNNFIVKEEYIPEMIERFKSRKGNVDRYDGFAGFMLVQNGSKMSVLTGWATTEDFTAWVESEAFQNSHVKKEQRVKSQGSNYLEAMPVRENYSVEG